jgi:hypothetical protein
MNMDFLYTTDKQTSQAVAQWRCLSPKPTLQSLCVGLAIFGFKRMLKFTLKQLLHVSVQSPSSGSILFELAKVTVIKIVS